jgi:hypothetical protein
MIQPPPRLPPLRARITTRTFSKAFLLKAFSKLPSTWCQDYW